MIVKSLSRKTNSFKQLLNYIMSDKGRYDNDHPFVLTQNIKSDDVDSWVEQFEMNESFRKNPRKNSLKVIHEVLSFSPNDRAEISKETLEDITYKYLQLRSPNGMFVCVPHVSENHYHIHICGSPLEYLNGKSIRMSRKEFKSLKMDIQDYQEENYPEISHSVVNHDIDWKNRHLQRVIPFDKTSEWMVKQISIKATSFADLIQRLKDVDIEVYYRRGNPYGVWINGKKRRFRSIGVKTKLYNSFQKNKHSKDIVK